MQGSSITAVILGRENFGAEKLESKLVEQGIRVVKGDYEEIPENSAYIFDFEGREDIWLKLNKNQRLVLIEINGDKKVKSWEEKLKGTDLNWRIVVGENVYGEGMDEESFLGRAFVLAAKNKSLILPSLKQFYRVLAIDDMVEAILRSCFFSGTSGKILVIGGKEVNSKIVAEVLVEEAKMTKSQVVQDDHVIMLPDGDTNLVEKEIKETRELLRWEAEITFTEGAKEVVQYFVAKVDQENRRKPTIKNSYIRPQIKREEVERRFEVEIEEEPEREIKKEIEIEIEEENEEKVEVEIKDEFKLESFKKSPLPERKIEEVLTQEAPTFVEEKHEEKIEEKPRESKAALVENKKNFKKYWKWGLLGMGWLFLVILLINAIKIVTVPKNITKAETLVESGKYDEAKIEIEKLTKNNEEWSKIYNSGNVGMLLRAEGEVIDLLSLSIKLAQSGEKISSGIFGEREIEMKSELQYLERNLDEAISKMGILQGRLSGRWQWLPGRFRDYLGKMKTKLEIERESAEKVRKILPILPEFLGLDEKRREYMVLLQNENELRPSGGFIGSYAMLSFEGGKMLGFEVKDIYEADGQLKGHVEPPAEIKKYLGEANWFMRDANWQANFPTVSRDIQWFLEKETGRKVDGIIGLNLATVRGILGVVGEIYVPDFKEKVNESNLYEQAEYYSENQSFAGSVQKASFLGATSKQLIEEMRLAKGALGQKLITEMIDLLERNEIQVILNEKEAAGILEDAGYNGAIYEGKCNPSTSSGQTQCLADYLYIVEANLGVNKANYFIYRNIERQVEIGEKSVKNTLKISYENTAKSLAWPGGDYKNYMRIYIPTGSGVLEVNWSENGSGEKKIISGDNLKISQVEGKEEIGFLVTVPIGKKINVEVKYVENIEISSLQTFSYLNYIQRQSGFGDTGMVTLISIPENWQINAVHPEASVVGGKLLFNQKLDRDIIMGVDISR